MQGSEEWEVDDWGDVIIPTLCELRNLQELHVSLGREDTEAEDEVVAIGECLTMLTSLSMPHHVIRQPAMDAVLEHLPDVSELTLCGIWYRQDARGR